MMADNIKTVKLEGKASEVLEKVNFVDSDGQQTVGYVLMPKAKAEKLKENLHTVYLSIGIIAFSLGAVAQWLKLRHKNG